MDFSFTYESYDDLLLQLRSEENARRFLAYVKCGGNPICPYCGHQGECSYDDSRKIFYCGNCARQFSITTGSIFERSHLPLMKWFKAMFEIANGSISSVRLAKKLNVNQRTAWKIEQKIRQSLKDDLDNLVLSNIVEADTSVFSPDLDRDLRRKWRISKRKKIIEQDNDNRLRIRKRLEKREQRRKKRLGLPPAGVGGRPKGFKVQGKSKKEKRKNQYYKYEKWVLAMVERGGKVFLQTIGQHNTDMNKEKIAEIMSKRIEKNTRVITDGGGEFEKVSFIFPGHEKIIHDPWVEFTKKDGSKSQRQVKKFVEGDKHTNTVESVWAHVKRIQWGHHIQISYGHADRYLYEFAFQRNNRELTDVEKFQILLQSALKMAFPYPDFKCYTRVYRIDKDGNEIGERLNLRDAA